MFKNIQAELISSMIQQASLNDLLSLGVLQYDIDEYASIPRWCLLYDPTYPFELISFLPKKKKKEFQWQIITSNNFFGFLVRQDVDTIVN